MTMVEYRVDFDLTCEGSIPGVYYEYFREK